MQMLTYVVCLLALLAIACLWIRFTSRRRPPRIGKFDTYIAVCEVCCGMVEIKTGPVPQAGEVFVHFACALKVDAAAFAKLVDQRTRFRP
jgi:hypothetical protein